MIYSELGISTGKTNPSRKRLKILLLSGRCALASVWVMKVKSVILLSSKGLSIAAAITVVTGFVVLESSFHADACELLSIRRP